MICFFARVRPCLASLFFGFTLALSSPAFSLAGGLPAPGEEFPVVWWAQNHVKAALDIFRNTTWKTLGHACSSGRLSTLSANPDFQIFIKNEKRREFCRRYPGPTHHLLQEAPYFMVRPPGDQK